MDVLVSSTGTILMTFLEVSILELACMATEAQEDPTLKVGLEERLQRTMELDTAKLQATTRQLEIGVNDFRDNYWKQARPEIERSIAKREYGGWEDMERFYINLMQNNYKFASWKVFVTFNRVDQAFFRRVKANKDGALVHLALGRRSPSGSSGRVGGALLVIYPASNFAPWPIEPTGNQLESRCDRGHCWQYELRDSKTFNRQRNGRLFDFIDLPFLRNRGHMRYNGRYCWMTDDDNKYAKCGKHSDCDDVWRCKT